MSPEREKARYPWWTLIACGLAGPAGLVFAWWLR